jgi:hypothetical protein
MLTPFLGELGNASIARAVVAAAGAPGRALVAADSQLARALGQKGFQVLLVTESRRVRPRPEFQLVRASGEPPAAPRSVDVLVLAGRGPELRGAADDGLAAAALVRAWAGPLRTGGRLVLVDRLDGGLLGARPTVAREDLCAALLAARLWDIAQAAPRGGTVVTYARVRE